MQEPLAFLGGRWIAASAAAVSVSDVGFILGASVAEQMRTFAGQVFHLDDHLARLAQSLAIVGLQPGMTGDEFAQTARELVARNHALLAPGDDLALSIFVTPGDYPTYGEARGAARRQPACSPGPPSACTPTLCRSIAGWRGIEAVRRWPPRTSNKFRPAVGRRV